MGCGREGSGWRGAWGRVCATKENALHYSPLPLSLSLQLVPAARRLPLRARAGRLHAQGVGRPPAGGAAPQQVGVQEVVFQGGAVGGQEGDARGAGGRQVDLGRGGGD